MKNKVKLLILVVIIIILCFCIFYGINIGQFKIYSISQIIEENKKLNEKLEKASNLTTVSYENSIKKLEETFDRLKLQKSKYDEIADSIDTKQIVKTQKQYDITYLWKVIGKYVNSRNLQIGMDVEKSGGNNLYNLNFSVKGEYTNISQLITDLENNSDLNFRIYNFKITGSESNLTSTFKVMNINIDSSTITATRTQTSTTSQTKSSNSSNTNSSK